MLQVINALEADKRCQVLVLTGAGNSFCAGMDLKEFFRDNDNLAAASARTSIAPTRRGSGASSSSIRSRPSRW